MKKIRNSAQLSIFIALLSLTVLKVSTQNETMNSFLSFSSNNGELVPEHSVPGIRKMVIPFYEQPFEPKIVDKVDPQKRIIASPAYSRVETLYSGQAKEDAGYKEKPVIYTTVIEPKSTNIKNSSNKDLTLYKETKNTKKARESRSAVIETKEEKKESLRPGQFSIPVTVAGNAVKMDPTKQQYLKPDFEGGAERGILIDEKVLIENKKAEKETKDNKFFEAFNNEAKRDHELIQRSLKVEDPKDLDTKLDRLLIARKQIKLETKELLLNLRERISKLKSTTELNKRLGNLIDRFSSTNKDNEQDDVNNMLKKLEMELESK